MAAASASTFPGIDVKAELVGLVVSVVVTVVVIVAEEDTKVAMATVDIMATVGLVPAIAAWTAATLRAPNRIVLSCKQKKPTGRFMI